MNPTKSSPSRRASSPARAGPGSRPTSGPRGAGGDCPGGPSGADRDSPLRCGRVDSGRRRPPPGCSRGASLAAAPRPLPCCPGPRLRRARPPRSRRPPASSCGRSRAPCAVRGSGPGAHCPHHVQLSEPLNLSIQRVVDPVTGLQCRGRGRPMCVGSRVRSLVHSSVRLSTRPFSTHLLAQQTPVTGPLTNTWALVVSPRGWEAGGQDPPAQGLPTLRASRGEAVSPVSRGVPSGPGVGEP